MKENLFLLPAPLPHPLPLVHLAPLRVHAQPRPHRRQVLGAGRHEGLRRRHRRVPYGQEARSLRAVVVEDDPRVGGGAGGPSPEKPFRLPSAAPDGSRDARALVPLLANLLASLWPGDAPSAEVEAAADAICAP
eukprot:CAMPEP_0194268020 /NCGR_PEP_ID=MMETSP0169-20130528/2402_1 /TAXON_ID=218684 /ORGANISM="Corethron pennatum, Strain L29A3" /LENGTH=133 /DNA_ID=CAMNT_0039009071 /DNA_START=110 /DNA_END=508 /DNA_ORIENTATION=+